MAIQLLRELWCEHSRWDHLDSAERHRNPAKVVRLKTLSSASLTTRASHAWRKPRRVGVIRGVANLGHFYIHLSTVSLLLVYGGH